MGLPLRQEVTPDLPAQRIDLGTPYLRTDGSYPRYKSGNDVAGRCKRAERFLFATEYTESLASERNLVTFHDNARWI